MYQQKQNNELHYKYLIKIILKSTIIWFVGYGITWLSKWILFDIIYNENLINSALHQILYRSTGNYNNTFYDLILTLLSFIYYNLKYCFFIYFLILVILIVLLHKRKININILSFREFIRKNIPIIVISILPLIWCTLLASHTTKHVYFIYRNMSIFLCGTLICFKNIFIVKFKKADKY